MTFPYEQTVSGEAAAGVPGRVRRADGPAQRAAVRAARGGARRPPPRARCSRFRSRWPRCASSLAQFVSDVFASTRFDQQILLRGVYFTSGTQEGTPIDRLLGAIGRRFGVAAEAVAPPPGRGKAYLRRAAAEGRRHRRIGAGRCQPPPREAERGSCSSAPMRPPCSSSSSAWLRCRSATRATASTSSQVSNDVATVRRVRPAARAASLETLLPCLNAVRAISDSANRYRDDTPLADAMGALSGELRRQRRARRLRARAGRHRAAAVRIARPAASDRLRRGAGEAVSST